MIQAIIFPEVIEAIRNNQSLRNELAEINGIDAPAVNAMLRKQANGLPHAQKLTNFLNLTAIKKAYGYEKDDEVLEVISVD